MADSFDLFDTSYSYVCDYALIYKIFDGVDYISVDFHVYELTFFHKPYIRLSKNKSKLKLSGKINANN